ncbi:MAG: hydroxymethylbilane synthase [bacterium]|nr:hydroxymethylbilane synthase [bacterium]
MEKEDRGVDKRRIMKITVGTRGSKLALIQTDWVIERLHELYPRIEITVKTIKTKGDRVRSTLEKIRGKGFFVKEIEEALLNREIDMAVHSIKDLPTELPKGLLIGAVTKRLDPGDALISKDGKKIDALPANSSIGTSSLRRKAQLLAYRQDLKIRDLRGNLDTRFKKLEKMEYSAIVVAACGVERFGWKDKITQILPTDIFLPASGQGALGIEIRVDDEEIKEVVKKLNDENSHICIVAERSFISTLGGGCRVPIGVLGDIKEQELSLQGVVLSPDGKRLIKSKIEGSKEEAIELGKELAFRIIELGGKDILKETVG